MPTSARYRPITVERLVDELADRVAALAAGRRWTRVLVDGADGAAGAGSLADALVDPVRVRGHEVLRVAASDFLRPASLRLERGRTDPDSRYDDWLDVAALRREVLTPVEPSGTGMVLPALWDAGRDRAFRRSRTPLADGGVVLLDGELLLGRRLPAELSVHLWLSPGALRRRVPEDTRWALPAYARYEREVRPATTADVVVRVDDPRRPALREG
ncbi:uridine kinase [Saccharomonospora piscinae]|uniref:uridine kinase n=1 Tax=Saccharomonospora piscinae TaxID=687388 RepID=UPI00110592AF|nr:uridine kinase [Saccharomonospora piscinae]TLW91021.1 uridine kinase [Saccharomonospora piscinae]